MLVLLQTVIQLWNLFVNHIVGEEQDVVREWQHDEERNVRIRITSLINHHAIHVTVRTFISIHDVVWKNHDIARIRQYPEIGFITIRFTTLIMDLVTRIQRIAQVAFPHCKFAIEQCFLCVGSPGRSRQLVITRSSRSEVHRYWIATTQCNRRIGHNSQVIAVFDCYIVIIRRCSYKHHF